MNNDASRFPKFMVGAQQGRDGLQWFVYSRIDGEAIPRPASLSLRGDNDHLYYSHDAAEAVASMLNFGVPVWKMHGFTRG